MERVAELLKPDGTFAMYNYYEPFLLDRYATTLKDVYGTAPCVELGDSLAGRAQAVLTAAAGATRNCPTPWPGASVPGPTDDYAFPYLQTRSTPPFCWQALRLVPPASLSFIGVG